MTTINGVNTSLSGQTGTGNFVGSASPTALTGYLQAPSGMKDANGNIILNNTATASAVNYIQIGNAATGNSPTITATGSDSVMNLNMSSKSGGFRMFDSAATNGAFLSFVNAAGTAATTIGVAAAQATSVNFNLPATDTNGFMISDGSGNLSLSGIPADITGTITVNGFSSFSVKVFRKLKIGKMVYIEFAIIGTSNSTAFTVTGLPNSANATVGTFYNLILVTNNGSNIFGMCTLSGTTLDFFVSTTSDVWTNSGTKAAYGAFWYESV